MKKSNYCQDEENPQVSVVELSEGSMRKLQEFLSALTDSEKIKFDDGSVLAVFGSNNDSHIVVPEKQKQRFSIASMQLQDGQASVKYYNLSVKHNAANQPHCCARATKIITHSNGGSTTETVEYCGDNITINEGGFNLKLKHNTEEKSCCLVNKIRIGGAEVEQKLKCSN